jgi:hypothetical protein
MDDRYYRSACSVIVVSTGDVRSATTFQGIRNYNIARTCMTIMVFTIFLLRYSIRCSEALLNPMTRHFVIRHTKYDPCKLHTCAQQQQQQRTHASISLDSFSRKHHNHANNDDSSNSLLLDDLLNEVLKSRPKNDAAVDSTTTTTATTKLVSSQQNTSRTIDNNDKNGWRCIDWATTSTTTCTTANTTTTTTTPTSLPPPPPSPVDIVMVRDRLVYIKRDDQVR